MLSHLTEDVTNRAQMENATFLSTSSSNLINELTQVKHLPASTRDWIAQCLKWLTYKVYEDEKIRVPMKGDNGHADAAGLAAFKSFQSVIGQLRQPGGSFHFCTKKPVKSICESVLRLFDLFSKDSLEENCVHGVHLKEEIMKAADLAEECIKFKVHRMLLPKVVEENEDQWCLGLLQQSLTVNYFLQDTSSNMQYATKYLKDDLVGLDADFKRIKERLIGTVSELEIIPIIGMAGIGKTTLATKVYKDTEIQSHFHVHAWAIVSREYCEKNVLLQLLQLIDGTVSEELYKEEKEELAEILYRKLKGMRYFVVIDDIWTTEAWDHLKLCFPDDGNGSRIILTSRHREVALHVNPENPHFMNFLSPGDSWDLLRKQVFGQQACLPQLVNVGKQIAKNCQGLPLAIKVVAGFLSKISKKLDCWIDVAKRVRSATDGSQAESVFKILSMSYNDLPQHLKACFISLVIFPKNYEIPVGKLIKLWIAMGFLYSESNDLEEVAMKFFEDLISRSLIMVRKRKFDGQVKSCSIHDLLWDLSMRKARKEGPFVFGNSGNIFGNLGSSHSFFDIRNDGEYIMGLSRSLLLYGHSLRTDCTLTSPELKLLRVLQMLNQSFDHFPYEITDLVNLRYLAIASRDIIPAVSKLCNLETLINNHKSASPNLPKEIWSLSHLRYLHFAICTGLISPVSALPDLREFSTICSGSCTKEVLLNFPNLLALRIHHHVVSGEENMTDELLFNCLSSLIYLQQLEKLTLSCTGRRTFPTPNILEWDAFLPNIKQLTLIGTCLPWNEMNALAMLSNLEVLKLKLNSFIGSIWEMDDAFVQLRCLMLQSLDLEFWKANQYHFPKLERLVIQNCAKLLTIPTDFGELSTLNLIDIDRCHSFTTMCARDILTQQRDFGNEKFSLCIGRPAAQQEIIAFLLTFLYMTMQLKMLSALDTYRSWVSKIKAILVFLAIYLTCIIASGFVSHWYIYILRKTST